MIEELEEAARARFVRWDAALWREIVAGPATELARALDAAGGAAEGQPIVESYLRLACEAVGLGYLFPAESGRESFFTLAFRRLLPAALPALPPARRAEALASIWNLAENLESAPVWLARIFYRVASSWSSLSELERIVGAVETVALQPPAAPLGERPRVVWVRPADEDRRFLPGALHFVAPAVLCVHDRLREGVSQAIWLAPRPLLLGAMGCGERPGVTPASDPRWTRLAEEDPRFAEPHAAADNAWRAAATLVTSQQLVALLPQP